MSNACIRKNTWEQAPKLNLPLWGLRIYKNVKG